MTMYTQCASTPISDAMCDFLGIEYTEQCSRVIVTRELNKYIKENNLQHPDVMNTREFYIDSALSKITNVDVGKTLTYFNIQKHINHNFPCHVNELFVDKYKPSQRNLV
jgi:chromatin remodeling complex protein RSC6